MCHDFPKWARNGGNTTINLEKLIDYGSDNYGRHTDWFLRHRNTGLRNLAVLIAAEFTVASLYFSNTNSSKVLSVVILFVIAIAAPLLWLFAYRSCRSSFRASLESAILVTKVAWAMGIIDPISIKKEEWNKTRIPVPGDTSLYIWRYWNDAKDHHTTNEFVNYHLKARGNTYYWAKMTIGIFCIASILFGIVAGICILVHSK